MRYISMFSGIEAATVAWLPLGWEAVCYAEISPFPSAVLQHRFPGVPNVDDMSQHDWSRYRGQVDGVVGGPPCQAFSVAGLRQSLEDDRGNLSLQYMRAIHAIDPLWCLTENVPGWLSTRDNAFGCFLAGLVGEDAELLPPGGRWTDAGVVVGPQRTAAWRILDAQYFQLAQRRRRVYVLSFRNPGGWAAPAALFPISDRVQRHPPPRRGARQGVAGSLTTRAGNGSRPAGANGNRVAAQPLKASHFTRGKDGAPSDIAPPLSADADKGDQDTLVATALRARDQSRGVDSDATDTLVPTTIGTLAVNAGPNSHDAGNFSSNQGVNGGYIIPTIGFNARQDPDSWDERAGPLDTRSPQGQAIAFDTTQITHTENRSNPQPGDPCHLLAAQGHPLAIAFQDRFRGDDGRGYDRPPPVMEEQTGTLETVKPWNVAYEQDGGPTEFLPQSSRVYMEDGVAPTLQGVGTHNGQRTPAVAFQTRVARNGRGQPEEEIVPALNGADAGATSDMRPCVAYPALSFQERGREGGRSIEMQADVAYALTSPDGGGRAQERNILSPTMKVRRLTPTECERLQGFPDGWTLVPYRGKPAADGNRYAALGNSMAVPVIRKLGERILLVDRLLRSGQTQESPAPRVGQQPAQGSDEPAHAPMASGKHED